VCVCVCVTQGADAVIKAVRADGTDWGGGGGAYK